MCTFSSSTNKFIHAQTLFRMSSLSGRMNIARVNIEFFTGCKKIKQRRISFVLGYLRMILWKFSTAISIKHRILATFNIKKISILTACMTLTIMSFQHAPFQVIFQIDTVLNNTVKHRCFLFFSFFLMYATKWVSIYLCKKNILMLRLELSWVNCVILIFRRKKVLKPILMEVKT